MQAGQVHQHERGQFPLKSNGRQNDDQSISHMHPAREESTANSPHLFVNVLATSQPFWTGGPWLATILSPREVMSSTAPRVKALKKSQVGQLFDLSPQRSPSSRVEVSQPEEVGEKDGGEEGVLEAEVRRARGRTRQSRPAEEATSRDRHRQEGSEGNANKDDKFGIGDEAHRLVVVAWQVSDQ